MEIIETYNKIRTQAEQQFGGHLLSTHELISRDQFKDFIIEAINKYPQPLQMRLKKEFFGLGPLESLLENNAVTEILVNGQDSIWYEENGHLNMHHDQFLSEISYANIIERLSQEVGKHLSLQQPFIEGHINDARVSIVEGSLAQGKSIISIRKHPRNPWTLDKLCTQGWCTEHDKKLIQQIVQSDKNFLIIGETGSGKTSVANACLQNIKPNERTIIIEDSSELHVPNKASIKLLTREDPYQLLTTIDQQELLKRSLRLRPDRLVMGEIRNKEAKDFLMLLATGHKGCFATLHAQQSQEALIRLEMLIQLGAPQWSLPAIRRLIFLSLHYIIVTGRSTRGERKLIGIYKLNSLEDSGITLDSVASITRETTSSE